MEIAFDFFAEQTSTANFLIAFALEYLANPNARYSFRLVFPPQNGGLARIEESDLKLPDTDDILHPRFAVPAGKWIHVQLAVKERLGPFGHRDLRPRLAFEAVELLGLRAPVPDAVIGAEVQLGVLPVGAGHVHGGRSLDTEREHDAREPRGAVGHDVDLAHVGAGALQLDLGDLAVAHAKEARALAAGAEERIVRIGRLHRRRRRTGRSRVRDLGALGRRTSALAGREEQEKEDESLHMDVLRKVTPTLLSWFSVNVTSG
jgi:hypothetical protein